MKRIYIYSQNQLNLDFWREHICFDSPDSVVQFTDVEEFSAALANAPSLVLIDNYFHDESFAPLIQSAQQQLDMRGIQATLVHISPCYADRPLTFSQGHVRSSLSPQLLAFINELLSPTPQIQAA